LHDNVILELKDYHERYIEYWINYWIDIGLNTNPTNEKKAEEYFVCLFKQLNLKNLKHIIWCDNPAEMFNLSKHKQQPKRKNVAKFSVVLWNKYFNQMWNKANSQIKDKIMDRLIDEDNKIAKRIICEMVDKIKFFVFKIAGELSQKVCYGQHDASWLVYYAYCMQVLRVEAIKILVPMMLLAQEVNWWIVIEKTIYAIRKPKEYIVENNKVVKVVYQDGYVIA
jgi:hypothetical protein